MAYRSVDELQKALSKDVFHYAQDSKKAAGRALGTIVELITFYALVSWKYRSDIAIERSLPEYCNQDITHNVEYSLHHSSKVASVVVDFDDLPITGKKIIKSASEEARKLISASEPTNPALLTKDLVLRNACVIAESPTQIFQAHLVGIKKHEALIDIVCLLRKPYSIFECKRVGVEEGTRKGPQTIEKAKQGAYVAKSVSSLQKVRLSSGKIGGLIELAKGEYRIDEYDRLMEEVIYSGNKALLRNFILTVGVVSNHGNWFTSENHNKELKVLAQSYDWLLFLTDAGLAEFIEDVIISPKTELKATRKAFLSSYNSKAGANCFTKVKIDLRSDGVLRNYFSSNIRRIEGWFNVIAPAKKSICELTREIDSLRVLDWPEINR